MILSYYPTDDRYQTLTMIPAYLEIIPPMNDSAESPHQVGYESKIHIRCHASEVVSPKYIIDSRLEILIPII